MKILIFGATGILGVKLLKHLKLLNIDVDTAVYFKNVKLIKKLKNTCGIKNTFSLDINHDYILLNKYLLKKKFDIIYLLDSNLTSLPIVISSLKFQKNCTYAIANKDLLIAGGSILVNKIFSTKNFLYPLDSEHFSLIDMFNYNKKQIKKVYITASGGPFYFKRLKLDNVSKKQVLKHPKWNMGNEISIDSSNFVNKILEIFELSVIYNFPLEKIDFIISQDALVHSVIIFHDGRYILNAFKNEMLIPLVKPLEKFGFVKNFNTQIDLEDNKFLKLNFRKKDKRFKIFNKINQIKKFSHSEQINFLILNKKAHILYLSNKLEYSDIIDFIFKNLKDLNNNYKFRGLNDIVNYIQNVQNKIYL